MFYAENLEQGLHLERVVASSGGQVLGQNFCDIFEIFRANRAARFFFRPNMKMNAFRV